MSGIENAPGDDQDPILSRTNKIRETRFFVKLPISLPSPYPIVIHAAAEISDKSGALVFLNGSN